MYSAITGVEVTENYFLILTFENGEKRLLDMKPYLKKGIFKELQDESEFRKVRISFDTIGWANEADLDPEFLYNKSHRIES
jgi:hypothetical protein